MECWSDRRNRATGRQCCGGCWVCAWSCRAFLTGSQDQLPGAWGENVLRCLHVCSQGGAPASSASRANRRQSRGHLGKARSRAHPHGATSWAAGTVSRLGTGATWAAPPPVPCSAVPGVGPAAGAGVGPGPCGQAQEKGVRDAGQQRAVQGQGREERCEACVAAYRGQLQARGAAGEPWEEASVGAAFQWSQLLAGRRPATAGLARADLTCARLWRRRLRGGDGEHGPLLLRLQRPRTHLRPRPARHTLQR